MDKTKVRNPFDLLIQDDTTMEFDDNMLVHVDENVVHDPPVTTHE